MPRGTVSLLGLYVAAQHDAPQRYASLHLGLRCRILRLEASRRLAVPRVAILDRYALLCRTTPHGSSLRVPPLCLAQRCVATLGC
jgi:hypothetical protein